MLISGGSALDLLSNPRNRFHGRFRSLLQRLTRLPTFFLPAGSIDRCPDGHVQHCLQRRTASSLWYSWWTCTSWCPVSLRRGICGRRTASHSHGAISRSCWSSSLANYLADRLRAGTAALWEATAGVSPFRVLAETFFGKLRP